MVRRELFFFVALIVFGTSCNEADYKMSSTDYSRHITEWDSARLEQLKSPGGWLNLAGLFWLQKGVNRVGSDSDNDIVFPRGPAFIGELLLEEDRVVYFPESNAGVYADGENSEGPLLIYGDNREAEILTVDSLSFFIIRRGDRIGIRLRDYLHPRLEALKYIERFPPDQEWIIRAEFIKPETTITVMVPDVLGDISEQSVPGILEFEFNGEVHQLYPTGSGERLFIIFADDTNALQTYGGGRFLSADPADSDGFVYLDFNKAYNPPCAFSPFATCPLPPKENFLPFGVEAGEKAPGL